MTRKKYKQQRPFVRGSLPKVMEVLDVDCSGGSHHLEVADKSAEEAIAKGRKMIETLTKELEQEMFCKKKSGKV